MMMQKAAPFGLQGRRAWTTDRLRPVTPTKDCGSGVSERITPQSEKPLSAFCIAPLLGDSRNVRAEWDQVFRAYARDLAYFKCHHAEPFGAESLGLIYLDEWSPGWKDELNWWNTATVTAPVAERLSSLESRVETLEADKARLTEQIKTAEARLLAAEPVSAHEVGKDSLALIEKLTCGIFSASPEDVSVESVEGDLDDERQFVFSVRIARGTSPEEVAKRSTEWHRGVDRLIPDAPVDAVRLRVTFA
jgi:hypothetical protein